MPEFEEVGGGRKPSPKFKLNKKTIIMYGGIVLVVFFVITKVLRRPSPVAETQTIMMDDKMPNNSVDVQAQMDNFSSIMQGYVDTSINQMYSEISSQLNQQMTELGNTSKEYDNQLSQLLNEQLNQLKEKQNELNTSVEKIKESSDPNNQVTVPKYSYFRSQVYDNIKQAQSLMKHISEAYGGKNVQIVRNGSGYEVKANFDDDMRSYKVGERLKERGLVNGYHVEGSP
jgi:prefoldin subunit 5